IRALAMTGMVTASWISTILSGSAMRATPPSALMSAGTRSSAMTATAPASSAIRACSAVVTSMITPPLSISATPLLTRIVPISAIAPILASALEAAVDRIDLLLGRSHRPEENRVLVRAHDVGDVRAELLRGEHAVGVLEPGGGVGALGEGHPDGVAGMEGDQAPVRRSAFDDADLRGIGRNAVMELGAEALRRRRGLVDGRFGVAAGHEGGDEEERPE